MKKFLTLSAILFVSVCGFAQDSLRINKDSLLVDISERMASLERTVCQNNRYKLYQTENVYTLLKLDTSTGEVEQVQWSFNDNQGCTYYIDRPLIYQEGPNGEGSYERVEGVVGRFELYPTLNLYQFILLDQVTGKAFHVQWGFNGSKRWMRAID